MTRVPAPRLEVVRDGEHARTGPGVLRMTHADFFERLALWGALGKTPGLVRDDDAPLFFCAAALNTRGPLAARLAPALAELWREIGEAGVSAAELSRAMNDGAADQNEGARAAELGRLAQQLLEVERRMHEAGLVDRPRAWALARALLHAGQLPGFLRGVPRIDVLGLVEASDVQVDLLIAIARAGQGVRVSLPVDVRDRGLAAGLEPILKRLEAAHDVDALDVAFVDVGAASVDDATPGALAAAMFADERASHAPAFSLACADKSDEARAVAGVIARLRADDPDARIAVALRSLDGDERRFADALAAQGLAVRHARRPLTDTTAGRLALDVLALATEGAPRDRLVAVLTSPVTRDALSLADGGRVLRVLRRAAARTDVEDRATPHGGYLHRLTRFRQGLGARERALADDTAFAIDAVTRVLSATQPLAHPQSLAVTLAALRALLTRMIDDGVGLCGAEVIDVVDRLAIAAERARDGALVAPRVVAHLVERALQSASSPDRVADDSAVWLLAVPQLWGQSFDHVVVAGVEEGRFPLPHREGALLSDADRARINGALGRRALRTSDVDPFAPPGAPQGALALEPLWLVGAMGAARASFGVTMARRDNRGRELSPSSFFLEIERALGARAAPRRVASPREQRVILARARARGEISDEIAQTHGVEPALLAHVDRCALMARERSRFFQRRVGAGPWAARAPFAFAVDPARIERAFGHSFGLLASRPLTPTRLEALAECRMHGFVQHVLKVDLDEPAGNAADARVLGSLAHAVLERFFLERKAARVPLVRFDPDDRRRLRALFDDETGPLLAGRATGHLAAIQAQLEWLKTALSRAVSMLLRDPKVPGVEPVDLELHIGVSMPNGDPPEYASVPIEVQHDGAARTLFIGGIIDRVDEGGGGRVVLDYKTASTSSIRRKAHKDALFDKHFQLLLYLRLVEHHRPSAARVPLHGYLVSLREGTTSDDVGEVPELRARVLDDQRQDSLGAAVGRVVLPVLRGVLPPDATDRCDECRLQRLCRVPLVAELAPDLDDNEEGASS